VAVKSELVPDKISTAQVKKFTFLRRLNKIQKTSDLKHKTGNYNYINDAIKKTLGGKLRSLKQSNSVPVLN